MGPRDLDHRRRHTDQLLDMDDIRPELLERAGEGGLRRRVVEIVLGAQRAGVAARAEGRVHELEHGHPAALPAAQAVGAHERVPAAREEVAHVVSARHLRVHHVLCVDDDPAVAERQEPEAQVEDPHRGDRSGRSLWWSAGCHEC